MLLPVVGCFPYVFGKSDRSTKTIFFARAQLSEHTQRLGTRKRDPKESANRTSASADPQAPTSCLDASTILYRIQVRQRRTQVESCLENPRLNAGEKTNGLAGDHPVL